MRKEPALLALQRATHATLHRLSLVLADLALTASEINALGNLGDGQARTTSQLGAAVGARPTTLTGVLDRLESRGYITRTASPTDRRATVITATTAGRRVARRIRKAMTELERRAVAGLPPESVEAFHTVLTALTEEPS
ncbi:MarR family winged helix-turn-helix transcriptional regulator [Actinophytocola sp.]|uniref:MarR family winged helix-turn-helix transcriptional regulator n=1 Tax=Actinophytocola sp. TaxID=1872138 RepID=UPI00389A8C30